MSRQAAVAGACLLLIACSDADDPATLGDDAAVASGMLSAEELRDPETCKSCHPVHYREWSASMHAYAAQDPVFLAMNRRGQRETEGRLGTFCLQCHAPMAVVDGLTDDGLDLEQLPDLERGVSCYFCHNVTGIEDDHNAKLRLAHDATMRGPIDDPVDPVVHGAEYSDLFQEGRPEGAALCGSCHDIVTPRGVHLERTFEEYRAGLFSRTPNGEPPAFETCSSCHMPPKKGMAAVAPDGVGTRTVHEHLWPGVDVAITDFPHRAAMESAVEDCQLGLGVSFLTLEVTPPDLFTIQLETGAGHHTPSGAAQDRRMWIELLAYDADGALIEGASSGRIADGELEEFPEDDPRHDPQLVMFRDRIFDAEGEPVHMFWEAARSPDHPYGYESHTVPVATTTYIEGKHAITKQYRVAGPEGLPARVTVRLRMRPIGQDVLDDLVRSGDLDPALAEAMPTFTFPAQLEWTPDDGVMKTVAAEGHADCETYRCLLDPMDASCE